MLCLVLPVEKLAKTGQNEVSEPPLSQVDWHSRLSLPLCRQMGILDKHSRQTGGQEVTQSGCSVGFPTTTKTDQNSSYSSGHRIGCDRLTDPYRALGLVGIAVACTQLDFVVQTYWEMGIAMGGHQCSPEGYRSVVNQA